MFSLEVTDDQKWPGSFQRCERPDRALWTQPESPLRKHVPRFCFLSRPQRRLDTVHRSAACSCTWVSARAVGAFSIFSAEFLTSCVILNPCVSCMPAHTTRRLYFLFVPQNKERESRRELAQELLSSQPLFASISHNPVGRAVRAATASAWGREGGWASSDIPQPCSRMDSVPALPSAKPSMRVWVHGKGEKGFPPVDSTYLLRIQHSFSRSEIRYGQAGIVSLGICEYNPKCRISSLDFPPHFTWISGHLPK